MTMSKVEFRPLIDTANHDNTDRERFLILATREYMKKEIKNSKSWLRIKYMDDDDFVANVLKEHSILNSVRLIVNRILGRA